MTKHNRSDLRLTLPAAADLYTAVCERDASYDGQFYYGVVTTGVFCRPSCASRAPNRDNVRFFADTESAAAAGFRPCKRCHPGEVERDMAMLAELARFIDDTCTRAPAAEVAGRAHRFVAVAIAKEIQDGVRRVAKGIPGRSQAAAAEIRT